MEDTFFWIIVTQRSPYNGTLTDDMWVSWLTLEDYPGFGRMMDFFAPEMECFSGLIATFSGHMEVAHLPHPCSSAPVQQRTRAAASLRPTLTLLLTLLC